MLGANDTITIKTLVATGGKEYYQTAFTGVSALIEQVQPELAPMFNARSAYSLHKIFIEYSLGADGSRTPDVKPKDRVIDSYGNEYAVEGAQPFRNREIPDHIEITANKKD